jgi:curved DNA-binding protein
MKVKDYYKILGVERTASSETIKKAYHRLARIYHPDRNENSCKSITKFNEITEAYKIIGNLDNRLIYSSLINGEKKLLKEIFEHEKKNE